MFKKANAFMALEHDRAMVSSTAALNYVNACGFIELCEKLCEILYVNDKAAKMFDCSDMEGRFIVEFIAPGQKHPHPDPIDVDFKKKSTLTNTSISRLQGSVNGQKIGGEVVPIFISGARKYRRGDGRVVWGAMVSDAKLVEPEEKPKPKAKRKPASKAKTKR